MLPRYAPLLLVALVAAGCAGTATTAPPPMPDEPAPAAPAATAPPPMPDEPAPAVPAATAAASNICATSAILVNSCRPWSGGDIQWLDVADGSVPEIVAAGAIPEIVDGGQHLLINWRPAQAWADVPQARVDQVAAAIRSIAPKKIFLSLHGAPEADVTTAVGCDDGTGEAGTPADYRRMWKLVRARFDELGVTNVVWVMGYANDPRWDCLVPELYPGDRYVDWIMFGGAGAARFQRMLMGMNGPDRQVLTKPWAVQGVAEGSVPNVRAYITPPG